MEVKVLAHNIRSMHNIGSIFRTCDGAGIKHLYLSGYSACPPRKEIRKSSVGVEDFVSWSYEKDPLEIIGSVKKDGYKIAILEQAPKSISYLDIKKHFKKNDKILLILGEEIKGVDKNIIKKGDICIEIPMFGQKQSLNVSIAFGTVAYSFSE